MVSNARATSFISHRSGLSFRVGRVRIAQSFALPAPRNLLPAFTRKLFRGLTFLARNLATWFSFQLLRGDSLRSFRFPILLSVFGIFAARAPVSTPRYRSRLRRLAPALRCAEFPRRNGPSFRLSTVPLASSLLAVWQNLIPRSISGGGASAGSSALSTRQQKCDRCRRAGSLRRCASRVAASMHTRRGLQPPLPTSPRAREAMTQQRTPAAEEVTAR